MLYLKIKKLSDSLDTKQWNGANDFRVLINYGAQKRNTTVLWDDNNPVWNESFLFDLDKKVDEIIVKLAEEDKYGKTKILMESNISVHDGKIKSNENELIKYEIGNIFFKNNIQIMKLKHKLENLNIKIDNINLILNE
jgi:Ca2+-dependent lipid-binding protein